MENPKEFSIGLATSIVDLISGDTGVAGGVGVGLPR